MNFPEPVAQSLPFGLTVYDVARFMRRAVDARVRSLGLSMAQWRTLAHLYRMEGCRQAALAEVLEIAPITLGRLLDRMCAQGLVERRPDPGDRRAFQLYLLPAARPLLDDVRILSIKVMAEAMTGVPAERQAELMHWLSVVRSNLEALQPKGEAPAADDVDEVMP
jgi:MarR family transcriptional regulator for hemolysin